MAKSVNILGTRGIPAAHGGFETFAQGLSLYLVERGWTVTVYCQTSGGNGESKAVFEDYWNGVKRVHIPTIFSGTAAAVEFDFRSMTDVLRRDGVDLVLGYNTALLTVVQKLHRRRILMNMDGIEWRRRKWGLLEKAWLLLNEIYGARFADTVIADHPEIARHLCRYGGREPVVIPYGSPEIADAPTEPLDALGLEPGKYFISVARIEPENSILELVQGFSSKERPVRFVVLGKLDPGNAYHRIVQEAASDQVVFPGAIYAAPVLVSLRKHCLAYAHGHTVGGTNPSLVEALGAGNAIIAQDNPFNRWTAGDKQFYFSGHEGCAVAMDRVLSEGGERLVAQRAALERHAEAFTLNQVHFAYERALDLELRNLS